LFSTGDYQYFSIIAIPADQRPFRGAFDLREWFDVAHRFAMLVLGR
jgi:hypothetical protein